MVTTYVLRNVAFEDLGCFEAVLKDRKHRIVVRDAGVHAPGEIAEQDPDLLVVLGGPISVHDTSDFQHLVDIRAILRERLQRDRPTLGVCLGAQLMAIALGAQVTRMGQKEIGFGPLSLTGAGRASALGLLGAEPNVLHWHGEEFSLPEGAALLASTPGCQNQAFSWRKNGLALQFHLEVEPTSLERWYIGHVVELGLAGIAIADLRRDARLHGPALVERAQRVLARWLAERDL